MHAVSIQYWIPHTSPVTIYSALDIDSLRLHCLYSKSSVSWLVSGAALGVALAARAADVGGPGITLEGIGGGPLRLVGGPGSEEGRAGIAGGVGSGLLVTGALISGGDTDRLPASGGAFLPDDGD